MSLVRKRETDAMLQKAKQSVGFLKKAVMASPRSAVDHLLLSEFNEECLASSL